MIENNLSVWQRIKFAWQPKQNSLHLACRKCNQRLDTKQLTDYQAIEWLRLWHKYHKDHEISKGE